MTLVSNIISAVTLVYLYFSTKTQSIVSQNNWSANVVAFQNREEVVARKSRLAIGRFKLLREQHVARRSKCDIVDK